jgi:hypothetical protein
MPPVPAPPPARTRTRSRMTQEQTYARTLPLERNTGHLADPLGFERNEPCQMAWRDASCQYREWRSAHRHFRVGFSRPRSRCRRRLAERRRSSWSRGFAAVRVCRPVAERRVKGPTRTTGRVLRPVAARTRSGGLPTRRASPNRATRASDLQSLKRSRAPPVRLTHQGPAGRVARLSGGASVAAASHEVRRAGGHLPHPRRAPPFVHPSERRRVQA